MEKKYSVFDIAQKSAIKDYNKNVANGHIGYLTSLEGLLKDSEIISNVNLGLQEIPLEKVIGTYTHLRSLSFASNFMPLQKEREFSGKWEILYSHQINEGINDPIKVYEYLSWYYVIEGNKRVSVMKYCASYAISAYVIRIIPQIDESNDDIMNYFEYLKFNKITGITSITFSKKESYSKVLELLDSFNPNPSLYEDKYRLDNKYRYLELNIYNEFKNIFIASGGMKLPISIGDAFFEYISIYGIPEIINLEDLKKIMGAFIKELQFTNKDDHIENYFKDKITTTFIENVPEDSDAFEEIKLLAEDKYDVIFTTSPVFKDATLQCALLYPNINFFNCSDHAPYKHLSNYFGRSYEPRFLTGIIAGVTTKTNIIGYAATSPTPDVISSVNAFALGVNMVNPEAVVKVVWTREWNSHLKFADADKRLLSAGADIISNRNLTVPRDLTKKYGVYSMLCKMDIDTMQPLEHLAAPIWHWGIFYEKIVANLLSDSLWNVVNMYSDNDRLINFWWGMDSGVLDIYYSKKYVPQETQKLIELMKQIIINDDYNPFTGPIKDNCGTLRIEDNSCATVDEILNMDWFVESVEAEEYSANL